MLLDNYIVITHNNMNGLMSPLAWPGSTFFLSCFLVYCDLGLCYITVYTPLHIVDLSLISSKHVFEFSSKSAQMTVQK